jgi:hypothetical protein
MTVHNHGPNEGPGLSCRETRTEGGLIGACLMNAQPEGVAMNIDADALKAAAEVAEKTYLGYLEEAVDDEHDLVWDDAWQNAIAAAAPYLMAQAWDEGHKSGFRYANRISAAKDIDHPELPGLPPANPYKEQP